MDKCAYFHLKAWFPPVSRVTSTSTGYLPAAGNEAYSILSDIFKGSKKKAWVTPRLVSFRGLIQFLDEHPGLFHIGVIHLRSKDVPRIGKNCRGDGSSSLECNVFSVSSCREFLFRRFQKMVLQARMEFLKRATRSWRWNSINYKPEQQVFPVVWTKSFFRTLIARKLGREQKKTT